MRYKIKEDLSDISLMLEKVQEDIKDWEQNLKIDGKNIELANIEHASWLGYYDSIKVELKYILDYLDYKSKKVKYSKMKDIMANVERALADRTVEKLAEETKAYEDVYTSYLEVKYYYSLLDSIVSQFVNRGYALNNLVKIREKELQGITLYLNDEDR